MTDPKTKPSHLPVRIVETYQLDDRQYMSAVVTRTSDAPPTISFTPSAGPQPIVECDHETLQLALNLLGSPDSLPVLEPKDTDVERDARPL